MVSNQVSIDYIESGHTGTPTPHKRFFYFDIIKYGGSTTPEVPAPSESHFSPPEVWLYCVSFAFTLFL